MSPSGRGSVWVKEFLIWRFILNFFRVLCSGIARGLHAKIYVFFISLRCFRKTEVHDLQRTNVPGKFVTHDSEDRLRN